MNDLHQAFTERKIEVETYIDFLQSLEDSAKHGPPMFVNVEQAISARQQKILYSSVYLQLYNLVESTITRCIDAVSTAPIQNGSCHVKDLTDSLRSEWVRGIARTHKELNAEHRFSATMELCNHLIEHRPVTALSIEKGGGGNWDDTEIENISKRIGFDLSVSTPVYQNIKRPIKDGKGALQLVKKLRNDLAHGSISFSECANEVTVSELRDLKDNTVHYLHEVIENFTAFIDGYEYLVPDRRPERQSGEQEHSSS
ncbi:MAG: MAE_28990/MAE_18760 family HEPN-like nuclease [Methylobacter sp.]